MMHPIPDIPSALGLGQCHHVFRSKDWKRPRTIFSRVLCHLLSYLPWVGSTSSCGSNLSAQKTTKIKVDSANRYPWCAILVPFRQYRTICLIGSDESFRNDVLLIARSCWWVVQLIILTVLWCLAYSALAKFQILSFRQNTMLMINSWMLKKNREGTLAVCLCWRSASGLFPVFSCPVSVSRFDVVSILRCLSAHPRGKECLFESPQCSCQIKPAWLFSPDLSHAVLFSQWMFYYFFCTILYKSIDCFAQ